MANGLGGLHPNPSDGCTGGRTAGTRGGAPYGIGRAGRRNPGAAPYGKHPVTRTEIIRCPVRESSGDPSGGASGGRGARPGDQWWRAGTGAHSFAV
ncbi:hypothetical protein GCM10019017_19400 [Streptomyces showdoensis]